YNYTTTDINQTGNLKSINSVKSKFQVTTEETEQEVKIPEDSPFTDWKDARKFAGPLPHTFTYNKEEKSVLIIRGIRKDWKPTPVKVVSYDFEFLNNLKLNNVLANAFEIKNVPYYWEKGKLEQWK
ncbi:hypothetical protein N9242_07755, partial [Vicingaceae bacterium]|nr:hypothetical protein [Vicingaceae bacterium]